MIVRAVIAVLLFGTTVLGVLAWRHWTDETNTLPIRRLISENQWRDLGLPDQSDQPLVVLVPATTDTFFLINRSSSPLKYYGEPITGRDVRPLKGVIEPHYRLQALDDDGQWQKRIAWMCAGVEMIVPAGHAGRFKAPGVDDGGTYRVGVTAEWIDAVKGVQTETLWSPVIKR